MSVLVATPVDVHSSEVQEIGRVPELTHTDLCDHVDCPARAMVTIVTGWKPRAGIAYRDPFTVTLCRHHFAEAELTITAAGYPVIFQASRGQRRDESERGEGVFQDGQALFE